MFKNILVADLSGSQHLFEILQISLTFKNSENVVKSGCFEKRLPWRVPFFFEMKEGYKVSGVKILEVDICLKYSTPCPLCELVKTW